MSNPQPIRSSPPSRYIIALCDAVDNSFGIAIKIGTQNSQYNVEASEVIKSIVTVAPAPDGVAIEVLNRLEQVHGISPLGKWTFHILAGVC